MFDDIFPKQSFGATPKNTMRQTMEKVGVEGFRTQIVNLPNGDTAIYRSKNGHPEFVVQRKTTTLTPEDTTGLYIIKIWNPTPKVYNPDSITTRRKILVSESGATCTDDELYAPVLPVNSYWVGTAVSVPVGWEGPTNGAWIIKYSAEYFISMYNAPYYCYRRIGDVLYKRQIYFSNAGVLVFKETIHPSGTQTAYVGLGWLHNTFGSITSLPGGEGSNYFMSFNANATGDKARCLAKPTTGHDSLHLYEYNLDTRIGTDLGKALSYTEAIAGNNYSGSMQCTWATGYVGDDPVDLKTISSSEQTVVISPGSIPTPLVINGTYSGTFSLVHNGVPLFTVTQNASSSSTTTYAEFENAWYDTTTGSCETVSFECILLYVNLLHGVVCVRVKQKKDTFSGFHNNYIHGGGYQASAHPSSQTHTWDDRADVRVYKDGVLIYTTDAWEAGSNQNGTGSDTVTGQGGGGFTLTGTQGGASNYTPFGYAFFIGDGRGAVRSDGKQIALVYEDLAIVLTKKGSTWVAAEMPSMSDNATSTGNLWTTSHVAYKYDSQVTT